MFADFLLLWRFHSANRIARDKTHVFSTVKQNSREVAAGQKWAEWREEGSKRDQHLGEMLSAILETDGLLKYPLSESFWFKTSHNYLQPKSVWELCSNSLLLPAIWFLGSCREMAPYQSPELTAACQARAGPPAICSQPQPELEREGASMQLWLGSQLLFGEAHTLSRALYLGKVLQCKRLIKLSNLLFVASLLWWQAMTCGNLKFWGNRGYFLVMGCSCIILREKLNPQWWFCHFLESNPCPFETSLLLICAWWM